jgi:hypothetical protein
MTKTKALVKNGKNLDDFETAFDAIQAQAMGQLMSYRTNMMEGAIKHIAAEAFQAGCCGPRIASSRPRIKPHCAVSECEARRQSQRRVPPFLFLELVHGRWPATLLNKRGSS